MNRFFRLRAALTAIALCLIATQTLAANNLAPEGYVGEWVNDRGPTEGEVARLSITSDDVIRFSREFESAKTQTFVTPSESAVNHDGIWIYQFGAKEDQIMYRLVLSGWSVGDTKTIFGMLYLYQKGELFNGLPVSFKPAE